MTTKTETAQWMACDNCDLTNYSLHTSQFPTGVTLRWCLSSWEESKACTCLRYYQLHRYRTTTSWWIRWIIHGWASDSHQSAPVPQTKTNSLELSMIEQAHTATSKDPKLSSPSLLSTTSSLETYFGSIVVDMEVVSSYTPIAKLLPMYCKFSVTTQQT